MSGAGVGGEGGGTGDHTTLIVVVVVICDGAGGDEVVEVVVVSAVVDVIAVTGAGVGQSFCVYSRGKEVADFIFHNET